MEVVVEEDSIFEIEKMQSIEHLSMDYTYVLN